MQTLDYSRSRVLKHRYFVQVMIDRHQELRTQIEHQTKRKAAIFTYEETMKVEKEQTKKRKRNDKNKSFFPILSLIRQQILFGFLQCGWSIEDRLDDILTVLVIVIFIATGVSFGMIHEGWGFVKSLYVRVCEWENKHSFMYHTKKKILVKHLTNARTKQLL